MITSFRLSNKIINQEDKELKQGEWNEGDYLKPLKKSDELKKLDKLVSKIQKLEPKLYKDFYLN